MKTKTEMSLDSLLSGTRYGNAYQSPFAFELAFTQSYRQHQDSHPAVRECAALNQMFPTIFEPIEDNDLFAGRICYPLVGFSPEAAGLGYYCREDDILNALGAMEISEVQRCEALEMVDFWKTQTTQHKCRAAYPDHIVAALPSDNWTDESGIAFPLYRMGGMNLDFDKLIQYGIPGLKALIHKKQQANPDEEAQALYQGMLEALDVLIKSCRHYAEQARALANDCSDQTRAQQLDTIAQSLEYMIEHKPKHLHDAIQLYWLYALMSGTWNYGRMDVYLGTFLANDIDSGHIRESDALAMLQSLWRLMKGYANQYNNRVFIGGKGRRNEADADRFAMLAMEATRTVLLNEPQLSMRFYKGQNPALMEKALTVNGEGRTFPMLYNDDVNIPAVMQAFNVSETEAEQYTPFGCGEYVLQHRSVGSPNGVINMPKALEVVLHNGYDRVLQKNLGTQTPHTCELDSFDKLWDAYTAQIQYHVEALAEQQKIEYDVTGQEARFFLMSMLYDDCIERGRGVFSGGVRYLGGTLETYGNNNVADSLLALKQLVYEEKRYTLEQVIAACDADFVGYEQLHKDLLSIPKYGNDNPLADTMAQKVHDHICHTVRNQAARVGLHSYLVVIINNWANALFGTFTAASPEGRHMGESLANGNNPTPGRDKNGVTAFLNSLAKLNPCIHAGAVQNMKFSKNMFARNRAKLEAMLKTYFQRGGTQAMLTVVNAQDLENAMREPSKWGHLMVRVGGFSSRFIDLPQAAQMDVLNRTLHE